LVKRVDARSARERVVPFAACRYRARRRDERLLYGYRGVAFLRPKRAAVLQAILLTSSLLLVIGMCGSLMWLAAGRVPEAAPEASETDA
jgi:hypothetical protein